MASFNTFVPLGATSSEVGRSGASNLSLDTRLGASQNYSTLLRNRSYARLDEASLTKANPPFDTGSAGRIIRSLSDARTGNDPRITRGYIRRSVIDNGDPTSGFRLYFMYNPEMIQRSYVSYLDQQALDPFNTIFGANNLVAPPGVLDFSFDLFFDRQTENANGSIPRGVLEDYDYFNLVVRGVVPDPQMPDLPDNGIMMINPRNITVVFSPTLSVQGRPNSATVTYHKFDHQMRPIRMTISLGMKVFYIGPVRADFTFAQSKEQGAVEATIPYENSTVEITVEDVKTAKLTKAADTKNTSGTKIGSSVGNTISSIAGIVSGPNAEVRDKALSYAEYLLGDDRFPYAKTRPIPLDPHDGLDCSGMVYWGYRGIGALQYLGLDGSGFMNGDSIRNAARRMGTVVAEGGGYGPFLSSGLQRGDIFVGDDHVGWCSGTGNGKVQTYESYGNHGPGHLEWSYGSLLGYWGGDPVVVRPGAAGNQSIANP